MAQPTRTFNLLSDQYPPHGYPAPPVADPVNSPAHYTSSACCAKCAAPIECIQITETMNFNMGNTIKYVFRADYKGKPLEDLKKARWYLDREITKREKLTTQPQSIPTTPDTSLRSIVNFDAKLTDDYWISTDRDRQARLKT